MNNPISAVMNRLSQLDFNSLPPGLNSGKLGISMLALLNYGFGTNDATNDSLFQLALDYFRKLITGNDLPTMSAELLDGTLAFPWAVQRLVNCNILQEPKELNTLLGACLGRYMSQYRDFPYQYNIFDRIYPIGIVGLETCPNDDSLLRYSREEQVIHRLRDCERILTQTELPLNNPNSLRAGQLHPMLDFVRRAAARNIFPKKCIEIENKIASLEYDTTSSNAADVAILNQMLGRNDETPLTQFADAGLFAFIYCNPNLMAPLYSELSKRLDKLTTQELIGFGFGLFAKHIYADYE